MPAEPPDRRRTGAQPPRSGMPRPLLIIAIGLPLLLAVAVATAGIVLGSRGDQAGTPPSDTAAAQQTGPLYLPDVPAQAGTSSSCTALLGALPGQLTSGQRSLPRRQLGAPVPPGAAAWGSDQNGQVVLRCGLDRPAELTPTAQLLQVSGVQWLQIPGVGAATWVVVDRPVYVALTLPDGMGSGPLQEVSDAVRATLPAGPVTPNGG